VNEVKQIQINDVVYDGSIYPRVKPSSSVIAEYADALAGGANFPPIILEQGTNRLLDGYHRWKAHFKLRDEYQLSLEQANGEKLPEPPTKIKAEFHVVPEGIEPKLYALYLSAQNGYRPADSEKETVAQEQFTKYPGTPIKTIAKYTGVSEKSVRKYIKPLMAKFEEDRRSVILRLEALGWTQQEIADKLQTLWPDAKGTSRVSVTEFLSENGSFLFSTKNDLDRGHEPGTIAQRYGLPEILAWSIALDGLSDQERMKRLGINIQPYDVWNFAKCHDLFGDKHPGRIPGEIVAHVLYFFTKPGDTVIDPMAGSGTTADVCLAFGRKCYAFDIDSRHERPDIISHNIAVDGWHERVKKADLIFWDPPYFEKMDSGNIGDDGYIEGSISKLPRDMYLEFFAQRLTEARQMVKPGTRLAFLMSDWDDNTGEREGIFVWHYADIIRQAGWKLTRHIQAPLSTQQVHPDIVNKFRNARRLARLERYLFIAEA
jgi:DNA modification methylase